jgi:hypothetical protein
MDTLRTLVGELPLHATALVALLLGVVCIVFTRGALHLVARARKLPVTRLDKLMTGALVRVEGRVVRGEEALVAPLSQKAVVWFVLEVFARRRANDRAHDVTIFEERQHARCVISDQHGLLEIPLEKARVMPDDKDVLTGAIDGAPAHIRDAIRTRHIDTDGLFYRERIIACGDAVSALGTVGRRGQGLDLRPGPLPLVVSRGSASALVGRLQVRALATGLAALFFLAVAFALLALARVEGA